MNSANNNIAKAIINSDKKIVDIKKIALCDFMGVRRDEDSIGQQEYKNASQTCCTVRLVSTEGETKAKAVALMKCSKESTSINLNLETNSVTKRGVTERMQQLIAAGIVTTTQKQQRCHQHTTGAISSRDIKHTDFSLKRLVCSKNQPGKNLLSSLVYYINTKSYKSIEWLLQDGVNPIHSGSSG